VLHFNLSEYFMLLQLAQLGIGFGQRGVLGILCILTDHSLLSFSCEATGIGSTRYNAFIHHIAILIV